MWKLGMPLMALLVIVPAVAVHAHSRPFTANIVNVSPPGSPIGRCAPAITVRIGDSVGSATGTSSLGAFEPEHSSCTAGAPPTPIFDGLFAWTFESGDILDGSFFGQIAPSGTPGVLQLTNDWTVTGGTGNFAGATGRFTSVGTVRFDQMGNSIGDIDFEGTINIVPEPAAWTMLILGFGIVGARMRARTRRLYLNQGIGLRTMESTTERSASHPAGRAIEPWRRHNGARGFRHPSEDYDVKQPGEQRVDVTDLIPVPLTSAANMKIQHRRRK